MTMQRGFTLIEMAIVLVIIGLIVAAVLVGRDLIKAAGIRATVSQLTSYQAASNTFRNKFNGIPGDLANPQQFFPGIVGVANSGGCADGNGLIETPVGACGVVFDNGFGGETALFWYELAQAQLIADNIDDPSVLLLDNIPVPQAGPGAASNLPLAKLGGGAAWTVSSDMIQNMNYFIISNVSLGTMQWMGVPATYSVGQTGANYGILTPAQAHDIDYKLDDGNPASGIVLSVDPTVPTNRFIPVNGFPGNPGNGTPAGTAATSADTKCYDGNVAGQEFYAVSAHPVQSYCTLSIRASF